MAHSQTDKLFKQTNILCKSKTNTRDSKANFKMKIYFHHREGNVGHNAHGCIAPMVCYNHTSQRSAVYALRLIDLLIMGCVHFSVNLTEKKAPVSKRSGPFFYQPSAPSGVFDIFPRLWLCSACMYGIYSGKIGLKSVSQNRYLGSTLRTVYSKYARVYHGYHCIWLGR